MSWMDTVEYEYKFKCAEGHVSIFEEHSCDREDRGCLAPDCDLVARYEGFKPLKMMITGKVAYDQNGRKAFRISHQDGTVRHVSETKMRYMETGDMVPSYTKEYAAHLRAAGKGDQLETQTMSEMKASRKATEEFKKRIVPVTSFDA
jgi:hypothetical protein